MEKQDLLNALKHISGVYFDKKDYISSQQISRAIDVVEDFDGVLPENIEQAEVELLLPKKCEYCGCYDGIHRTHCSFMRKYW